LEQSDLKFIIENTRNAENLTFYYCSIGRVYTINHLLIGKEDVDYEELTEALNLNPNLVYLQKELDLYGTGRQSDSKYLDSSKLNNLVEALSFTNLRVTLENVHLDSSRYDKSAAEKIFSKHGFEASISTNCYRPIPYGN
jgi:hypothetical protein